MMRAKKTEIALYALSGASLIGGVITYFAKNRFSWPMFALGGGLLAGGAAMTYERRYSPRGMAGALGLSNDSTHKSGGMTLNTWSDRDMDVHSRVELLQGLVAQSLKDPQVRKKALAVTHSCPARDDMCELSSIFEHVSNPKNVRYTGDIGAHVLTPGGEPEAVDTFQTARRTLEFKGGDCLPAGTLLLLEGHRLVPIEEVLPGNKIWGLDRWSEVGDVWYKGELPVDAIQLNNGSWFKTTGDHKVYVALCKSHPVTWEGGKSCSCGMENREVKRIRVSDLQPQMVLIDPDRIPFGTQTMDADRARIEGLYLSDGWHSHDSDFDIAGLDGHPKEEQKRFIEEYCKRMDISTTWFEKSIRVRDRDWALRMQRMGSHAPEKHALSIDLDEGAAAGLLRGIMADSDRRSNVLTTTSRTLATQARLLHKMFGTRCGESYIEDHGGLGRHPIWRITPRRNDGGYSSKKLLRVRAIERDVAVLPVYDISTDDHYVYLPEADVTVSNCDDHAVLNATLAAQNGFDVKFRITSNSGATWDHIYTMARRNGGKWRALDTTLGPGKFGKEPRQAKHIDFPA